MPEEKFTGLEDIRKFLREFQIYVDLNEWGDERAGKYLAVFLRDEARDFYHQQGETTKKSLQALVEALPDRCEGWLALLKYKKDFQRHTRKEREALHSYCFAAVASKSVCHTTERIQHQMWRRCRKS